MMDKDTLEKVAQNAHLEFTEEILDKLYTELSEVLDYFNALDETPVHEIAGLDPMNTIGNIRDDVPGPEIDSEDLLKDVDTYDGYVRGPRL